MSAPTYLDTSRVTAARRTCIPCSGVTRTGYGPKLASSLMLRLDGRRWHRVYVMCWSNSGTAYVLCKGQRLLLQSNWHPELDATPILIRQGQHELGEAYARHLDRQIAAKR